MNLAIGGFAAKGIVVLLILALTAVTIRVRFNSVLRLGPGIRTSARYRWAFLPSRPARLHRRLQVVVGVCLDALGGKAKASRRERRRTSNTPGGAAVSEAQQQLRAVIEEAVSLDRRLIAAVKATGSTASRRHAIRAIETEIERVEATARRLLGGLREARARTGPVAPDAVLDERADATRVEPTESEP